MSSDRTIVSPADTQEGLVNPGMGWVLHYYDNTLRYYGPLLEPTDDCSGFPGLSTVYFRLAWSHLEPVKGRFNWSLIDGPAQRFIDRGLKVAFRISCSESHDIHYATPQWVRDAGAQGTDWYAGRDRKWHNWEPRFDDPVFLRHLEDFLAVAAGKYDNNPNVAWFDVGSFGVWGEGHTYHSTKSVYPPQAARAHVELHRRLFPRTLLAINDDIPLQQYWDDYQHTPGLTLRDDSILVHGGERAYRSAHLAGECWKHDPVILEKAHYPLPKKGGFWEGGRKYAEATEAYRASYLSIHHMPWEFLDECRELVDSLNRRMGYRLNCEQASWLGRVPAGGSFDFVSRWRNVGVAPCYPGGHVAVTLTTPAGGPVAAWVDDGYNLRDLPVDELGDELATYQTGSQGPRSVRLPRRGSAPAVERTLACPLSTLVAPGRYFVWVSVGGHDGSPQLALPLAQGDGRKRYLLGQIVIEPPSPANLPPLSEQDVIRNGFIYKPANVALVGDSVVLADESTAPEAFADAREPLAVAPGRRAVFHGQPR